MTPLVATWSGGVRLDVFGEHVVSAWVTGNAVALGEAAGAMAEEAIRRGVSEERRAGG